MDRPVILFDLNGTLLRRKNSKMDLRPGLHWLLLLKEQFELGIYTSMTWKNAALAKDKLNIECPGLFDCNCILLHREHVLVVGKPLPWSSKKPVAQWLPKRRVWVVDDSLEKACTEEVHLFKIIETWSGSDGDDCIEKMTKLMLLDKSIS